MSKFLNHQQAIESCYPSVDSLANHLASHIVGRIEAGISSVEDLSAIIEKEIDDARAFLLDDDVCISDVDIIIERIEREVVRAAKEIVLAHQLAEAGAVHE